MNTLLDSLTSAQQQAVQHVDGPLLILAGPGSGKTRVVTHRIAQLLGRGIPPRQILALTFTNKAAEEMRSRLERLAPGQAVWVGTFHRFCARWLRQYASLAGLEENFSIYDAGDSHKVLADALREAELPLTHVSVDQVAREISRAKNSLITADQFTPRPGHTLGMLVQQVYPHYQRRLLVANAVDFDDLLLHVAHMLRENPELRRTLDDRFRYILVDEYQDTNFAQYAIVRALSQDHANLAVTGDPDQSIYGWRGANLDNILKFEHDYPDVCVVRLERNYRSTGKILRVADALIANNTRRKKKALYTENDEGRPVRLVVYPSSRDEAGNLAEQIANALRQGKRRPRDFAIFYRVNSLSRPLESALRSLGIPYQIVKGLEFYQRREVKDILAYLHLMNNPRSDVAFQRIINLPPRKIGKTTVGRLIAHANSRRCPLLDAAREAGLIESLAKRTAVNVAAFVEMYDRLCVTAALPLEEIMGHVLEVTGYRRWLIDSDTEEDRERLANIEELLNAAREFDEQHPEDSPLETFLEQTALVSDSDDWDAEDDRVSLMTLHAAKGLEFPVVFITAVEQGLLPHERSKEDPDQLEEERRLLFVGITRAEEELQLSLASNRFVRGGCWPTVPSCFLMELPRDEMEVHKPATPFRRPAEVEDAWDLEAVDETYEEEEYVDARPNGQQDQRAKTEMPRVMTAAEMVKGAAPTRKKAAPEEFCQGMLVNHSAHGTGRIVALSGTGARRTATVQFFSSSRHVQFVLLHSTLQPVRSRSS
ncbi:MAG: ATP-dependent helicase [Pirellulaceae bacterium]